MTDRVWRHRKPDWRGQRRIHGEISIFVPVSWQYISAGFLFFLLVGIVLASTASIPKVEVVPGTIQLSNGVIEITSSRSGVVSAIYVKDGERVDENGVVVAIRSEVDQLGRPGALHEAERAISVEDQSLSNQERLIRRAYDAQRLQIMQQISSIEEELVELDEQIALQEELRIAAEEDLERVKTVAVRGFISDREVNARHETTVSRRQHLSQLRQARTAKRSNVDELRQSLAVAGSKTDADIATIESARARVAQEAANVRGARAYALRAPIKGVADAIRTYPGQTVVAGTPLLSLVPLDASTHAELYVPSTAIGFIKAGQPVRLAIDTFPYQQFGTISGTIVSVSRARISNPEGKPGAYLAIVKLKDQSIRAFGTLEQLRSGMTLTARIEIGRRTILEWAFEPLYAVRER